MVCELEFGAAVTGCIHILVCCSQLIINLDAIGNGEGDSCILKAQVLYVRNATYGKNDRLNRHLKCLTFSDLEDNAYLRIFSL